MVIKSLGQRTVSCFDLLNDIIEPAIPSIASRACPADGAVNHGDALKILYDLNAPTIQMSDIIHIQEHEVQ